MKCPSTRSPFGDLLDEIREAAVKPGDSASPAARAPVPRAPSGREPELTLETGVVSGAARPGGLSRPWRWGATFALHGAFLAALVLVPLLRSDDLPLPASAAKVFFVQPLMAPPPPPPAAPAAMRTAAAERRRDTPPPPARAFSAPATTPPAEVPRDLIEAPPPPLVSAAVDNGVPGGVDDGVPGGIVGGVIERAAATEQAGGSTVRVGIDVKEPKKVKNVDPVYPEVAARGKVEGVVILEVTIRPNGHVEDVRVLRSIPLLDAAAEAAARQWVFTPTLLRGVPTGVIMTVSVRFSLRDGTRLASS